MSAIMETVMSKPTNHYTAMENIDQLKLLLITCYPVDVTGVVVEDCDKELKNQLHRVFGEGFLKQ